MFAHLIKGFRGWGLGVRLISILFFLFLFLYPIPYTLYPAYAQTPSYAPLPTTISPTSPVFTDLIMQNTFHTFSCLMVGSSIIGQPCLTYQVTKNAQGAIQSIPVLSQTNLSGGILGSTGSLIGLLYDNAPVKTSDYLASLGQGFGIVREAHAQVVGSGAGVLRPIIPLWQVSRNVAYLIMIIIFVIIGLMVMFRQRINPQTVITAQAALPGLVIGLVLITFSYFLAALISDTAFIGTNVVGFYFSQVRGDPVPQNLVKDLAETQPPANILSIFSKYVGIINVVDATNAVSSVWDNLATEIQIWLRIAGTAIIAQFALPFGAIRGGVGELVAVAVSGILANLSPQGIVGQVLSLMAAFILIYALLRLLLRLINAYLNIIFLTITAPFQFLAASLPGRQSIATNWILNMLAHTLAFPAVLAVLYFVAFILGQSSGPLRASAPGVIVSNSLIPTALAQGKGIINVIGNETFPLFGGIDLQFVRLLLAFGALVALPAVPDVIMRTIGRITQAGQLLGEEYGRGVAGGRGYFNQASGAGPAFAQRTGNLADQPFRQPVKNAVTGKIEWLEKPEGVPGLGMPTMGTVSKIKGSWGWQKTLGRWIK